MIFALCIFKCIIYLCTQRLTSGVCDTAYMLQRDILSAAQLYSKYWWDLCEFEMYCLEDNPLRCSISFSRGSSRHKTKTNTCTFKLAQVPPLPDLTHPTDSLLNTYRIIERHIYTYTYIHIYIHIYAHIYTQTFTHTHVQYVLINKKRKKSPVTHEQNIYSNSLLVSNYKGIF